MRRALHSFLIVMILGVVSLDFALHAHGDEVKVDPIGDGSVNQNERVSDTRSDNGDDGAPFQEVLPDAVTPAGPGEIEILSKTLRPPDGWKFREFRDGEKGLENGSQIQENGSVGQYPNPFFDLNHGPPGNVSLVTVLKAGKEEIQFEVVLPATPGNANIWPVRAEGNLAPQGGGGGYVEKHWRIKIDDDNPLIDLDIEIAHVDEDKEEDAGAYIMVNDEGDADPNFTDVRTLAHDVPSETVFRSFRPVDITFPNVNEGTLTLTRIGPNKAQLWPNQSKQIGEQPIQLPKTWDLASEQGPVRLWVEGIEASGNERDVEFRLTYSGSYGSQSDKAKLTVVEIDLKGHLFYPVGPNEPVVVLEEENDSLVVNGPQGDVPAANEREHGAFMRHVDPAQSFADSKFEMSVKPADLSVGEIKIEADAPAQLGFVDLAQTIWKFPADPKPPAEFHVRAVLPSGAMRDNALKLTYTSTSDQSAPGDQITRSDVIKTTAVTTDVEIQGLPEDQAGHAKDEIAHGALIPQRLLTLLPIGTSPAVSLQMRAGPTDLEEGRVRFVYENQGRIDVTSDAGGDVQVPTPSEWDIDTPPANPIDLYVFGDSASLAPRDNHLDLTVTWKPHPNYTAQITDEAKATVFTLEMQWDAIDEDFKNEPGLLVRLNNDDDNENLFPDLDGGPPIFADDDLQKSSIEILPVGLDLGELTLEPPAKNANAEDIFKDWRNATKQIAAEMTWTPPQYPTELWHESIALSTFQRAPVAADWYRLLLEYEPGKKAFDELRAAGVLVDLHFFTRNIAHNPFHQDREELYEEKAPYLIVAINDDDDDGDQVPDHTDNALEQDANGDTIYDDVVIGHLHLGNQRAFPSGTVVLRRIAAESTGAVRVFWKTASGVGAPAQVILIPGQAETIDLRNKLIEAPNAVDNIGDGMVLAIEGVTPGEVVLEAVFKSDVTGQEITDRIAITVDGFDVDIDSDNNNGPKVDGVFELPDGTTEEDQQEHERPGRLVHVVRDDMNWDGLADHSGEPETTLVPIVVRIPAQMLQNPNNLALRFDYMAAPAVVVETDPGEFPLLPNQVWRIWTIDGNQTRVSASVTDGQTPGHYVPSGESIPLSDFLDAVPDRNGGNVTLYVEALQTNPTAAAQDIEVELRFVDPQTTDETVVATDVVAAAPIELVLDDSEITSLEHVDVKPVDIAGLYFETQQDEDDWWQTQVAGSVVAVAGIEPRAFVLAPSVDVNGDPIADDPNQAFTRLATIGGTVDYRLASGARVRVLGGLIDDSIGVPEGETTPYFNTVANVVYGVGLPFFKGQFYEPEADTIPLAYPRVTVTMPERTYEPVYSVTSGKHFAEAVIGTGSVLGQYVEVKVQPEGTFDLTRTGRWRHQLNSNPDLGTPGAFSIQQIRADGLDVFGETYGTSYYEIQANIGGAWIKLLDLPIENLPIALSEPDPYTLHIARHNMRERKAAFAAGDPLPTPVPNPLPGDDEYRLSAVGSTDSATAQDAMMRFCLYMQAQLMQAASSTHQQSNYDLLWQQWLNFPTNTSLYQVKLSQIEQVLATDRGYASIWEAWDDMDAPQTQALYRLSRADGPEYKTSFEELRIRAKQYVNYAMLARLKWLLSVTVDLDDIAAGVFPADVTAPLNHHDLSVEVLEQTWYQFIMDPSDQPRTLISHVIDDWKLGHPFTEDLFRHMVIERYAIAYALLEYIEDNGPEYNEGVNEMPSDWPLYTAAPTLEYVSPGLNPMDDWYWGEIQAARDELTGVSLRPRFDRATGRYLLEFDNDAVLSAVEARLLNASRRPENEVAVSVALDTSSIPIDPIDFNQSGKIRLKVESVWTVNGAEIVASVTFCMGVDFSVPEDPDPANLYDLDTHKAARLLEKTLDEIRIISSMIQDQPANIFWQALRDDGVGLGDVGMVLFAIGDFFSGASDWYGVVNGKDVVTDDELSLGQRAFLGVMNVVGTLPAGTVTKSGKYVLSSAKGTIGVTKGVIREGLEGFATDGFGAALQRMSTRFGDEVSTVVASAKLKFRRGVVNEQGQAIAGASATQLGGEGLKKTVVGQAGGNVVAQTSEQVLADNADVLYRTHGMSALSAHTTTERGVVSPGRYSRSFDDAGPYEVVRMGDDIIRPKGVLDEGAQYSEEFVKRNAGSALTGAASEFELLILNLAEGLDNEARKELFRRVGPMLKAACFPVGTPVVMADGSLRPIEQVKPGDWVLSRRESHHANELVAGRVTHTTKRPTDRLIRIVLGGVRHARSPHTASRGNSARQAGDSGDDSDLDGDPDPAEVVTTLEHPFYVIGRGWTSAGELRVDDRLSIAGTGSVPIAQIEVVPGESTEVYNLRVERSHTYFISTPVGVGGGYVVWVHNTCLGRRTAAIKAVMDRSVIAFDAGNPQHLTDLVDIIEHAGKARWGEIGIAASAGSSATLGTNLSRLPITARLGGWIGETLKLAAHHVFPKKRMIDDIELRTLLNGGSIEGRPWPGIGFLVDDPANGVLLPRTSFVQRFFRGARHAGNHDAYTDAIVEQLYKINDDIVELLESGGSMKKALEQATERARQLQTKAKQILKDGNIPLHQTDYSGEISLKQLWTNALEAPYP